MLDVIISDFERTIKVTTKAEKASHREFVPPRAKLNATN